MLLQTPTWIINNQYYFSKNLKNNDIKKTLKNQSRFQEMYGEKSKPTYFLHLSAFFLGN